MRVIATNGQNHSYLNFVNALKSPATKESYENSLYRYMNHLKITNIDDLLTNAATPRLIEAQIIDYIMSLRNEGVAYSTIKAITNPIFTFYQLNDVLLNRKKVYRYLGEFRRVVKDTAYTTEQIFQMLQNADQRIRMLILILSSTGCRIGSLVNLTFGNLTKKPEYGIYKFVFYERTNNEYYTFTTRECASTGIDAYLEFRQRCGEKIAFNEKTQQWEPSNTPLIRQQFDINDTLQVRNPQPLRLYSLRKALENHLIRCGIRTVEHPIATNTNPNSSKRVRKSISLSTGFRKHVISTFIEAELNYSIRQLLVDHSGGVGYLDQHYFRPNEEQVLSEYLKAEPYLTIDPSVRLSQEVQTLRVEKSKMEQVLERINKLEDKILYQINSLTFGALVWSTGFFIYRNPFTIFGLLPIVKIYLYTAIISTRIISFMFLLPY